jgi:hypothetical protein
MGQQQGDRRGLGTVDNRGAIGTQGPPQSGQLKPAPPATIRPLLRDFRRPGPQGGRATSTP